MRGRSRRSRSGRKSRKSYWNGFQFQGQEVSIQIAPGQGTTASFWAKWPSQIPDGSTGVETLGFPTASDETLVRSITGANMTLRLRGVLQDTVIVSAVFGLIAWDSGPTTANDLELAINDPGIIPNPAIDWGNDWIVRLPFQFTRDNFSLTNQAESFIVSRAMRKLPPGTGILGILGGLSLLAEGTDALEFDWAIDGRLLLKSGYYSGQVVTA